MTMKKILSILILFAIGNCAYGQNVSSVVRKSQIAYDPYYYNSNLVSGAIADFNFANQSSVTTSSSRITQIVDGIGSVVSSQATAINQPTYNTSGGPNNSAYASFNGSQTLSGSLLTSSTNFTIFIVKRLSSAGGTSALGIFQNGTASNGYAITDNLSGNGGVGQISGVTYPSVSAVGGLDFYCNPNRWEIVVVSHSSGITYCYNSLGHKYLTGVSTNPVTPTTSHNIGTSGITSTGSFVGDISRILVYNTQLTDAQILQNCQLLGASL